MESSNANATDLVRRNAFNFALAAKNLVASVAALHGSTRVAKTAVDDIQFAIDLLSNMVIPGVEEEFTTTLTVVEPTKPKMSTSPKPMRHRGHPVRIPGSGKMLWMRYVCPTCGAGQGERCVAVGANNTARGKQVEKPHASRKALGDAEGRADDSYAA